MSTFDQNRDVPGGGHARASGGCYHLSFRSGSRGCGSCARAAHAYITLALVFALASAWMAGAGYAYVAKPYEQELGALRARAAVIESIEDRVITMTPAQRRAFDELFKRPAAKR